MVTERKPGLASMQTRLALVCAGLGVVACGVLTAALSLVARNQQQRDLERSLTRLVGVAAGTIDGDLHSTLRISRDDGTPAYAALKRRLQQVRNACGGEAAFVYTMRGTTDGGLMFVVDAETDPSLVSHLGDRYDDASEWLLEHGPSLTEASVEPGLNTDAWGTWMTGVAPIRTSEGVLDGFMGIDVPAASIVQAQRRLWRTAFLVFLATLPVAGGLGWWLGGRLAQPVLSLRQAAAGLGQGDFARRTQINRPDEIGDLARAFDAMADRLQESHDDLESRVAARTAELSTANEQLRAEVEERQRLEYVLRAMSERDGLTGLANRLLFDQRLYEEWRRAARGGEPLSLLMCDVDRFKAYNDQHGHLAGDECLRSVADVIRRTLCRASNLPARWGGEEFAVILAGTPEGGALIAAERVRQAVEEQALPRSDGNGGVVTISVGATTAYPAWNSAPEGFLEAADAALYAAKAAGRNCARVAPTPRLAPREGDAPQSDSVSA